MALRSSGSPEISSSKNVNYGSQSRKHIRGNLGLLAHSPSTPAPQAYSTHSFHHVLRIQFMADTTEDAAARHAKYLILVYVHGVYSVCLLGVDCITQYPNSFLQSVPSKQLYTIVTRRRTWCRAATGLCTSSVSSQGKQLIYLGLASMKIASQSGIGSSGSRRRFNTYANNPSRFSRRLLRLVVPILDLEGTVDTCQMPLPLC